MQWSLTGKPNSWASPRVALAVTPAVGTLTLLAMAGFVAWGTPGEDRAEALLVIPPMGLLFLAIHAGICGSQLARVPPANDSAPRSTCR